MEDLVSVIITVYNNENTLKDCLLSVVSQTYRNMEIIIIDDGSTDSSPMICDELLLSNSKLKVRHQIHSGLAASRNKGLELSSGRYVTFVNGTDLLQNTALENLKNGLDLYKVNLSIIRTYKDKPEFDSDKIITFEKEDAIRQLLISDLIQNNPYGKMFEKWVFDKVQFEENNSETLYKIFDECDKIAFMNNSLYKLSSEPKAFPLNSVLNRDEKIMKNYPNLSIYCKCNMVKSIQDEFYKDICNNQEIPDEQNLYDLFKKIVEEDDEDIIKFFSNVRKAHMYLLADNLKNYKIVCPVLPDLK